MAAILSIHCNSFVLHMNFNNSSKNSLKTLAILDKSHKMRVPFQLKQHQSRLFHELPSGLKMEVIFQKGIRKHPDNERPTSKNPPLVFVHGSFHAGWCWAVHWLPFFSELGHDCYAISLLAQGESDAPPGSAAGTLQTHASDVANFIEKEISSPPVLLGHSFGGLIVQSYISSMINEQFSGRIIHAKLCIPYVIGVLLTILLEGINPHPKLAGAVLVCSVPPSGNSGLVSRYLFSKPIAAFKVTLSLAAKGFATSLPLCKETFFSKEMEDRLVQRYQELMKESSRMPLFDLKKLNASLPVPSVPKSSVNILVVGARNDFIVDDEGLCETARFYGVTPICIEGVAHDIMLDYCWEKGAQVILSWLDNLNGHPL